MSKLRLLLKTDDEINGYVYSGSSACPGPQSRVFRCWCTEPATRRTGGGSYCMPIQEYNMRWGASAPLETPGGPQVEQKI